MSGRSCSAACALFYVRELERRTLITVHDVNMREELIERNPIALLRNYGPEPLDAALRSTASRRKRKSRITR